jgi:ElaB/YqjD/DUF883 family membrane-anchored ribosome-binding protein
MRFFSSHFGERRLLGFGVEASGTERMPESSGMSPQENPDAKEAREHVEKAFEHADGVLRNASGNNVEELQIIRVEAHRDFAEQQQRLAAIDAREQAQRARLHMMIEGFGRA